MKVLPDQQWLLWVVVGVISESLNEVLSRDEDKNVKSVGTKKKLIKWNIYEINYKKIKKEMNKGKIVFNIC